MDLKSKASLKIQCIDYMENIPKVKKQLDYLLFYILFLLYT